MICFSLVSYSFFGPNFFWLSWSRKNCIYFTLRSWIPWVPTRFQQQENHKRMNSEHSEKTGLWKSTGDGVKKSLFKRNWSFYSPAKPSVSRGVSPWIGIHTSRQEAPALPCSLLRNPPARSGLTIQKVIIQHCGFCLLSATF